MSFIDYDITLLLESANKITAIKYIRHQCSKGQLIIGESVNHGLVHSF